MIEEPYTCKKCDEELYLDDLENWDELACPECSEPIPWENMNVRTEAEDD